MLNQMYSNIRKTALVGAALAGGLALNSLLPEYANADSRFLNLKTDEAGFENVLREARKGSFSVYATGTKDVPGMVVLDSVGGYELNPTGSIRPIKVDSSKLEKMLRIADGGFWNSGATTILNPDGKIEAYILPKNPLYSVTGYTPDKTFKIEVFGSDTGGGGDGGGGGGDGGGGGGSGGSGD